MKGSKNIRGSTEWEKKFIDSFNRLCNRHHSWQVWQDFVNMSASAIANAVDRRPDVWKLREDSYMATVKRYSKEELNLITELLSITTLALEENPAQDFLGKMYMQFNLENKWHGQFFTPWHVAELMAKMLVSDETKEKIASQDYISVNDPCCGAGCMLIAFANVCKNDLDINYQQSVLFVAQDIDSVVAKMCYIQISLLGCPGFVIVGNSLLEPVCGSTIEPIYMRPEDIWYTPLYFTDVWTLRRIRSWNNKLRKEEPEPKPIQIPKIEKSPRTAPVVHNSPQKPIAKIPVKKKKPFSLKDFFTVKGKGKQ